MKGKSSKKTSNDEIRPGSFGSGSGRVKFGSGYVRVIQILFGLSSGQVRFQFGLSSVWVNFG